MLSQADFAPPWAHSHHRFLDAQKSVASTFRANMCASIGV
jgi:hypothetical protein